MGLFKKKQKTEEVKVPEANTPSSTGDLEILDFDAEPTEDKKSRKKENMILFGMLIGFILVVFLLPTLASIFKQKSVPAVNKEVDKVTEEGTTNGMLEIGKEGGYINAEKIRFYGFTKKTNNEISVIYLPDTNINGVGDLNIYIELYNAGSNLIYRTQFLPTKKLERRVQGTYTLSLNDTLYRESRYGKIVVLESKDFNDINDTMTCNLVQTEGSYNVTYSITYNFATNGLTDYKVKKYITNKNNETTEENDEITNNETSDNTEVDTNLTEDTVMEKYKKLFKDEYDTLSLTNIEDIELTDTSLNYSIDILNLDLQNSSYKLLYTLGSLKNQIKLLEEYNNWSCEE